MPCCCRVRSGGVGLNNSGKLPAMRRQRSVVAPRVRSPKASGSETGRGISAAGSFRAGVFVGQQPVPQQLLSAVPQQQRAAATRSSSLADATAANDGATPAKAKQPASTAPITGCRRLNRRMFTHLIPDYTRLSRRTRNRIHRIAQVLSTALDSRSNPIMSRQYRRTPSPAIRKAIHLSTGSYPTVNSPNRLQKTFQAACPAARVASLPA